MSQQSNPATLREQEHRYDSGIYRDCSCGWLAPITSWETITDLRKLQAVHAALAASGTEAAHPPEYYDDVLKGAPDPGGESYYHQPAQAAASPEGEGREQAIADMRDYCLSTHEGWPIAKRYDALRQSAAPAGGDLREKVRKWREDALNESKSDNEWDATAARGRFYAYDNVWAALAQESKTGAVTETK